MAFKSMAASAGIKNIDLVQTNLTTEARRNPALRPISLCAILVSYFLIQEAGGVVSDWTGGPDWLSGNILAGPPAIHEELLRLTIQ